MGTFSRFGANAGNLADTNIIAAVVPAAGVNFFLTDLVVATRTTAADTRAQVQIANDGTTFTTREEVMLPATGTQHTALGSAIRVVGDGTRAVRVNFIQGTLGPISVTLTGRTFGPGQRSGADNIV